VDAGQADVVEYLLRMGTEAGRALSYPVRARKLDVMEVILRMCPEIEVDDPVDDDREKGYCGFTSPIAVAVAWKFSRGLMFYSTLDKKTRSS
jgi:hypothetical protein